MKEKSIQVHFINKIKGMLPPNISLAEELSDVLMISPDSAYRRIRGETVMGLDEIVLLCKRYKVSFDSLTEQSEGLVTFNYQPLGNTVNSFHQYLSNILADLKKVNAFKSRQIIFAAEDIPVFHHFAFPNLTAFKIFYWNRSILNLPEYEGKKFDLTQIDPELILIAKDIIDLYNQVPSMEIWSEDTVNSTIKQIEFYWESGLFCSLENALMVCNDFESMIMGIQKKAEQSSKLDNGNNLNEPINYCLYNSEVMIGNNCILVSLDGNKATYLSHHTFNSMITTNHYFNIETENWLKNLIKKSNLISGTGEKQRYVFFKIIMDRFQKLKKKIEAE